MDHQNTNNQNWITDQNMTATTKHEHIQGFNVLGFNSWVLKTENPKVMIELSVAKTTVIIELC